MNLDSVPIKYVLDSNNTLHQIDYETLANLPNGLKNPYELIIFGTSYDGSKEISIEKQIASNDLVGFVKPVNVSSEMTTPVGINEQGRLFTTSQKVDSFLSKDSTNSVQNSVITQNIFKLEDELDNKISEESFNKVVSETNNKIQNLQNDYLNKISSVSQNLENYKSETNETIDLIQQDSKTKPISLVFEDYNSLSNWLSIQDNLSKIESGATFYLIQGDTDYFWDGNTIRTIKGSGNSNSNGLQDYLSQVNPTGIGSFQMNSSGAIGKYSVSLGYNSVASGTCSTAIGLGVISSQNNQFVCGKYNIEDTDNKYLFIVGNGASDNNKSNAFSVTSDGNISSYQDVIAFYSDKYYANDTYCNFTYNISSFNGTLNMSWDGFALAVSGVSGDYKFEYTGEHWYCSQVDLSYIADETTQEIGWFPISIIGISFVDENEEEINEDTISFSKGDYIFVHFLALEAISLRELYNYTHFGLSSSTENITKLEENVSTLQENSEKYISEISQAINDSEKIKYSIKNINDIELSNITLNSVTSEKAGLMSSTDKNNLEQLIKDIESIKKEIESIKERLDKLENPDSDKDTDSGEESTDKSNTNK